MIGRREARVIEEQDAGERHGEEEERGAEAPPEMEHGGFRRHHGKKVTDGAALRRRRKSSTVGRVRRAEHSVSVEKSLRKRRRIGKN